MVIKESNTNIFISKLIICRTRSKEEEAEEKKEKKEQAAQHYHAWTEIIPLKIAVTFVNSHIEFQWPCGTITLSLS